MIGRRGSLGFDLLDMGRRLRVMGQQVEAVEAVVIRLWIYRFSRLRRRRQHRSDKIINASQEIERVLLCFMAEWVWFGYHFSWSYIYICGV